MCSTNYIVVTIDGPAGTGKSTVARTVAEQLQYDFLDTGAMYRAVAAKCLEVAADPEDADTAGQIAAALVFDPVSGTFPELNTSLRTPEVTDAASRVAQHRAVRTTLVEWQRQFAACRNVVTEGRDQGTDVFPDAAFKFFLTASPEERASRRVRELESIGRSPSYDEVLEQIIARDERDRNRTVSPLRPAEDACMIDTTDIPIEEVVVRLVDVVKQQR